MDNVTGIGGVFIRAEDPKGMAAWYEKHLGIPFNGQTYMPFVWNNPHHETEPGMTVFSFFRKDDTNTEPEKKQAVVNFRVKDLEQFLDKLRSDGVTVVGEIQKYSYGNFAWILDPEGNKVELWEPIG